MLLFPNATRANFPAMKFTSFVAFEQLKIPIEFAPRVARFRRKPSAATSNASSHVASRSLPFSRTSGCVRRGYDPGAGLLRGMRHLHVLPEDRCAGIYSARLRVGRSNNSDRRWHHRPTPLSRTGRDLAYSIQPVLPAWRRRSVPVQPQKKVFGSSLRVDRSSPGALETHFLCASPGPVQSVMRWMVWMACYVR
jgi:hypothetical protein